MIRDDHRLPMWAVEHTDGWFLPGGKVHFGEDSAAALVRELHEELEIDLTVARAGRACRDSFGAPGFDGSDPDGDRPASALHGSLFVRSVAGRPGRCRPQVASRPGAGPARPAKRAALMWAGARAGGLGSGSTEDGAGSAREAGRPSPPPGAGVEPRGGSSDGGGVAGRVVADEGA
ncbi:NUDIX domain-containing protein [Micromonospora sp. KC207]|uniref:NUDIX domain-containing protein n=1 Tax=Micromonospora sp. KC207 TaxID=2530377 RepID=UPI00210F32A5|nr:NUDIX domain-containing protein [Micromonospora sp. KC207]